MKTVIFDLDGTLVDSREDICASINHVRRTLYGLPPLATGRIASVLNDPNRNLAKEFYGVEAYDEEAQALFEAHYAKECLKNARAYPGVREMLMKLREMACDLFVATNAPTHTSRLILQNNNLDHFFTDIIGADRVGRPKPAPDMLLKAMAASLFDEAWMVGDSPKDMMAAMQAGANDVFVSWGYTPSLPETLQKVPVARGPESIGNIVLEEAG